jgi:hypothetical protein
MPQVKFTSHLRRYFPALGEVSVTAGTVAELIAELDRLHPGLAAYLVDDRGALRQHVNVFIGDALIHDRTHLLDAVAESDHVFILQALSGG